METQAGAKAKKSAGRPGPLFSNPKAAKKLKGVKKLLSSDLKGKKRKGVVKLLSSDSKSFGVQQTAGPASSRKG